MTRLGPSDRSVYIAQGEQAIGDRPEHVITTILGSCVAACLFDPARGIGGMNHILIPGAPGAGLSAQGAGATAMERLINALIKAGCVKSDLVAKVFGGAAVVEGLTDVGAQNARFVFAYLETEGIPCVAESTGGSQARRLRFWPATGRVRQRLIGAGEAPTVRMDAVEAPNGVELL